MKFLLTAGYDRSPHTIYLAESLRRAGRAPAAIVIAYPFNLGRIKNILRQRGPAAIARYLFARRVKGRPKLLETALQEWQVQTTSLRAWGQNNGVPVHLVSDINSVAAIKHIQKYRPDRIAYTGGGILRRPFLDAARAPIFNAHSGPLPDIRGMNALEWSLLLSRPTGVTVHLIDAGIDTGTTVSWHPVVPETGDDLDLLRERLVLCGARGLSEALLSPLPAASGQTSGPLHRQCFVTAPALRELAAAKLLQRLSAKASEAKQ